jgi:hypothetical protein
MKLDDPFTSGTRRPSRSMPSVCALKETMQRGEVFVVGKYRYIVQEEISKEKFEEILATYEKHPAGVAGTGKMCNSTMEQETFEPGLELKFEAEHYYIVKAEKATGEVEMCHCGKPLHYSHPDYREMVQAQIDLLGEFVPVYARGKTWLVPRHYVALHGIKAETVHLMGFKEAK